MTRDRSRLIALSEENAQAGREMRGEAKRFASIAGAEPTKAVAAFNLFQTPEPLARRMADMIAGAAAPWLEPSAGLGRLYRAAREVYEERITLVENAPGCAGELYRQVCDDPGDRLATLKQRDFLACSVADIGGPFGGVIMNPPFKNGTDIKHIRHALTMLKPGGQLVALCYHGVRQRRELQPIADSWEVIADAFREEGTRAEVALLTITR